MHGLLELLAWFVLILVVAFVCWWAFTDRDL
jgi:hypothetical protein